MAIRIDCTLTSYLTLLLETFNICYLEIIILCEIKTPFGLIKNLFMFNTTSSCSMTSCQRAHVIETHNGISYPIILK